MEKMPEKQKKEILFADHFEEQDDLRYGRNAPIENTERSKKDLEELVDEIIFRLQTSGFRKKAVLFIMSNMVRAQETGHLVGDEIKRRMGGQIKVRYSINEDLRHNEEGEMILPENYEPGSFFEGLKIASDIFIEESLGSSKNMNYRYGDPVLQEDGSYKYPELAKYFKKGGETYSEAITRIFSSVVEMSGKSQKLDASTEVVLVSHGFVFHILRGLIELGEQVKNGETEIVEGEIAEKIYEIYKNKKADVKSLAYIPLDITNLGDRKLVDILEKEIKYLKENQNQ